MLADDARREGTIDDLGQRVVGVVVVARVDAIGQPFLFQRAAGVVAWLACKPISTRLSAHSNVYLNERRDHTHTLIHHSELHSFASVKQRFACALRTLRLLGIARDIDERQGFFRGWAVLFFHGFTLS